MGGVIDWPEAKAFIRGAGAEIQLVARKERISIRRCSSRRGL
jgi:hypothetical protein